MKRIFAASMLLLLSLPSLTLGAQGRESRLPLFPIPLHITREIEDPITHKSAIVEEYYIGNRVISIRGDKVTIADHAAGTLTEIDHAAGTWSETSFEKLAEARAALSGPAPARAAIDREGVSHQLLDPRPVAGRVGETFRISFDAGELRRLELTVDPSIELSRDAVEVISGAAWPNQPGPAALATIDAARIGGGKGFLAGQSVASDRYRLSIAQVLVFDVEGEQLAMKQHAIAIDDALPDPVLLAVPAGAERVESHQIRMRRLLEELDRLPREKDSQR